MKLRSKLSVMVVLAGVLGAIAASTVTPPAQPAINSLSVVGTNLVFDVSLPSGMAEAILEIRPTMDAAWQSAGQIEIPIGSNNAQFIIPKPALEMAFFRLRGVTTSTAGSAEAAANVQVSSELNYVAIPSLASTAKESQGGEVVFHFRGQVDGSDRIKITREGAFWEHVNWKWPDSSVTINGTSWNPQEKNFLTTTGAVVFLPEPYSLQSANLEIIEGRDTIAMELSDGALMVFLNDTPSGAATYEFKIRFHTAPAKRVGTSPPATLKIAARIDGSDTLQITSQEATWQHHLYSPPSAVTLNGIAWDLLQTNVLANAGTTSFLPEDVDFSTARVVSRKGRDLSAIWSSDDTLWVRFADNPNGSDDYELEISFGR